MTTRTSTTSDTHTLLVRVQQMLDQGQADQALALVNRSGDDSPAVRNAKGVCMMRLGQTDAAMKVFRALVFPDGAFAIPSRTPTIFRTNYVTSLLLLDNVITGISLLHQVPDAQHPAVVKLKYAIRQWKQSFPWWRRIPMLIGYYPDNSLRLDFEPGHIWIPETEGSPRRPEHLAA